MDIPSPPPPPPPDPPPAAPPPSDSAAPPITEGRRRPAPPLGEFWKYPATAVVGAAAVASTGAFWAGWDGDAFVLDARTWDGQFWRLVTSTLLHLGLFHLAFNLYWLWVLGTAVERVFRPLPTTAVFLLFAVGSSAAEYAAGPGVGLSGVGYGLFGLLLVLSRWDPRFAGAMDRRTAALFLAWFLLCWVMTRAGAWRVSNAAHASGAIFGLLLGLAVAARGARRAVAVAAFVAGLVLALVAGAAATPSAEELAYVGYQDLENGRNELAAAKYERAVELDPNRPDWWRNLGVARHRLGRTEEAVEAYRRALALRPQDREMCKALRDAKADWAYHRHMAGDFAGAVALYREVLAEDERSALTWYNLGLAYRALGQPEPAREALARAVELDPADERFRGALLDLARATGGPK